MISVRSLVALSLILPTTFLAPAVTATAMDADAAVSARAEAKPGLRWLDFSSNACGQYGGDLVAFQQVRATRPLTITSVRFADATRITGFAHLRWVTPVSNDDASFGGMSLGHRPEKQYRDRLHFDERQPLVGTRLGTGRHNAIVAFTAKRPAGYGAIVLRWRDDEGRTGAARSHQQIKFRKSC